MPNTTILKSGGACSDTSLPILYKDPAASAGSKFIYDALDTNSWPKQAAPILTDLWKNLVSGGDASFTNAAPGWGPGGFTSTAAGGQGLLLPATGKVAAGQLTGFAVSCWVKPTQNAGLRYIVGVDDSTQLTSQWTLYQSNQQFVAWTNKLAAGVTNNVIVPGTVYHVGLGYQGDGAGNFTPSIWLNGQVVGTPVSSAAATIYQPAQAVPRVLRNTGFSANSFDGTLYRLLFDDLSSGKTVAQVMADDFVAGLGRFS